MRTNMLHSNLLGRLGNGLLKFVVLVVMVCNMSGAFAAKATISDNASIKEDGTTISSGNGDTTIYKKDLIIEEKVVKKKVLGITYDQHISPSVSIGNGISDDKKEVVIVEGNLTIKNESILTLKSNSILIVKGNLTIESKATLKINEGANLFVYKNLEQKGYTGFGVTTGDVNAHNAGMIVVGENYIIYHDDIMGVDSYDGLLSPDDYDKSYIWPNNNTNFYVLGSNDLPSGHGTPKGPAELVAATGNSTLSDAVISSLLPIELTSFTATATDYGFVFNWITASEENNDYFTLEYSIDGVDFNEIDYVHGAGTTSETSEYEYRWDDAPEFDVVYFRLKQTDYNGGYSYSDVIVASRKKSSGANGTFRYGPLNLQIQGGELRYIQK